MCFKFPYSTLTCHPYVTSCCVFSNLPPPLISVHLHTFGCKQAHRSVEDVHPFTCVALTVMPPTPRVVQWEKSTALIIAIEKGNDAMVTALLDYNANPDIQDGVRQHPHRGYEGDERMDM